MLLGACNGNSLALLLKLQSFLLHPQALQEPTIKAPGSGKCLKFLPAVYSTINLSMSDQKTVSGMTDSVSTFCACLLFVLAGKPLTLAFCMKIKMLSKLTEASEIEYDDGFTSVAIRAGQEASKCQRTLLVAPTAGKAT